MQMKTKLYTLLLLILAAPVAYGQFLSISFKSGPNSGIKAYHGSPRTAGADWNLPTYNDSAWTDPTNGSVPDTTNNNGSCDGPNWSPWHQGDTAIWAGPSSTPPDTALFRKVFHFCGTVVSANINVLGDDYADTYINDSLISSQGAAVTGEQLVLSPTGLSAFRTGDNVLAFEVYNVNIYCAALSFYGNLMVDTTGCLYPAGIPDAAAAQVHISPVPVKDILHISLGVPGSYTLSLCNAIGQSVAETAVEAQVYTTMDVHDLPTGVYVLTITDGTGHVRTRRIAKD